jgi:hypothetical protein
MLERIATRRRLRRQRRVRDALLLDLGALVYELHRQGKRAPELLQEKAAELTVVDEEVRALEAELAGEAEEPWPPPSGIEPLGSGLADGAFEEEPGPPDDADLATDEQAALPSEHEEPRP